MKKKGETPLQSLSRLRREVPALASEKMTYAGRLDPMAEGLLLILVGDAVHEKEKFLNLDKEYEVDILFGVETDTYDVLGIVNPAVGLPAGRQDGEEKILVGDEHQKYSFAGGESEFLKKYVECFDQEYPAYSSRPVVASSATRRGGGSKPLFQHAREGTLEDVEIPTKHVCIKNIEYVNSYELAGGELLGEIEQDIGLVAGDFRQEDILAGWRKFLKRDSLAVGGENKFFVTRIRVSCSSGTYMRSLAHRIGQDKGVPALAYRIKRVSIGEYTLLDTDTTSLA